MCRSAVYLVAVLAIFVSLFVGHSANAVAYDEGVDKVRAAIEKNDLQAVLAALDSLRSPELVNALGLGLAVTPLQAAAANSKIQPEIVDLLLARGARADLNVGFAGTALHTALLNGNLEIFKKLLTYPKTNPWVVDRSGVTVIELLDVLIAKNKISAEAASDIRTLFEQVILQRTTPAQRLVVGFVGLNGGGNISDQLSDLESRPDQVLTLARGQEDKAKSAVTKWLGLTKKYPGLRRNVILVGASQGAESAAKVARWMDKTLGVQADLLAYVDGVHRIMGTLPRPIYYSAPAKRVVNYYRENLGFKSEVRELFLGGKPLAIAGVENSSLGAIGHNEALAVGVDRVIDLIADLPQLNDCVQALTPVPSTNGI